MASIFPDEGLDVIVGIVPKGGTVLSTTYVGLFTSSSGGSAVPASSATVAAMGTGYAECATAGWSTYARQSIASASWGTSGAQTIWSVTGRGAVGPQVSFPAPTAAYSPANPICGFFIADAVTAGHGIFYSNFSDTTSVASLAIGDVIKVTPTWGYSN